MAGVDQMLDHLAAVELAAGNELKQREGARLSAWLRLPGGVPASVAISFLSAAAP